MSRTIPLQQGLRLGKSLTGSAVSSIEQNHSITTRIKTHHGVVVEHQIRVSRTIPLQQGLRQFGTHPVGFAYTMSRTIPLQQGLRHNLFHIHTEL